MSNSFDIHDEIGAPIATTRLSEQALVCIPPRTAKFTLDEWNLSNNQRCRNTEDQQQLAQRILAECERLINKTDEEAENLKNSSDKRLQDCIADVGFIESELNIQRTEICEQLEALSMYKTRLQDCLAMLQSNAMTTCSKCLILRDGRLGIDLVVDDVERALQRERTSILGGQSLLKRALEQLNEQMRRLRSRRYLVDRDLEYKRHASEIDKQNLAMKPTSRCLSIYEGFANLDPANITADEYAAYSAKNIELAAKEVTSARPIKIYVDTLMKQVIEDLWKACKLCNHAFNQRIIETKLSKAKLEEMHKLTTEKIFAMRNNIVNIQKALAKKEGYVGLAHTRLGKRANRVGAELVRDAPGQTLTYECEMLRKSNEQLQQMMQEATSSLRYLLQTQIQLEEDINVKMNTLKIDEVDCMTLRATMDYHSY